MKRREALAVGLLLLGFGAGMAGCGSGQGSQRSQPAEAPSAPEVAVFQDPYAGFLELRGDLHLHSSTGSFDARECQGDCRILTARQQLQAARDAGLDFAALTEHDRDPNSPQNKLRNDEWNDLRELCREITATGFPTLCGYEWTHSQKSCASLERDVPDWNHKIVLLPPGAYEICDSEECSTPDLLADFLVRVGGVGFTPHPWRYELIDPPAGFPDFVTRDYFLYDSGPNDPFIGSEVGPDFLPIPREWAWAVVCEHPETPVASRTVTLPEWSQALGAGKRLAALATSDRHFDFVDFRQRTTVLFAAAKTPDSLLEALRARRTLAAYLEPFDLHFSIGGQPVGQTARQGPIRLQLEANPGEVREMKLRSPRADIASWGGDDALGLRELPLPASDPGPFWVEVYAHATDPVVGTPRATISSPIWIAGPALARAR